MGGRRRQTGLSCLPVFLLAVFLNLAGLASADVQLNLPGAPTSGSVVYPNFLGISLELSFMNEYYRPTLSADGNDTQTIPPAFVNYLTTMRRRTQNQPVRLRVGGNSMDSSTYMPNQSTPLLTLTNPNANANNQPANYGPMLWEVMKSVSDQVGGTEYLIGLSLLDPNNSNVPLLAGAAQSALGSNLDAFLLGNEPDLYSSHGNRPNIQNYTLDNYIAEFTTVSQKLKDTSAGDILSKQNIAGPTICCRWDLNTVLAGGYLQNFTNILKYVTMQHYPQNNCYGPGKYDYGLPYYLQHSETVKLASWQLPGIKSLTSSSSGPKLVMSEFNSASCGGIPGISDTFGAGSIWTFDYALQMASVGYSAAYLHTRERGISYNLFAPPADPADVKGAWTTNPPFYAMLAVPEALQSPNGARVVDLNLSNSTQDPNAQNSGYAVYDAQNGTLQQIVIFNYSNQTAANFTVPSNGFTYSSQKSQVGVKYLAASSITERSSISWGGQSLAGVGDGTPEDAGWATQNVVMDCSNGCTVGVPAVSAAVVFANGLPSVVGSSTSSAGTLYCYKAQLGLALALVLFLVA